MNLAPALKIIKREEGLRLHAYADPAHGWKVPTIGYGTTVYPDGKKVRRGDVITEAQAEEYLLHDLRVHRIPTIERSVKVPLNENELGALLSLCYNIGVGGFAGSLVVRRLNAGASRPSVARAFLNWAKPKILLGRRKREIALFLTPVVTLTQG